RRHTRFSRDWSSDVCSSDLEDGGIVECTTDEHIIHAENALVRTGGERRLERVDIDARKSDKRADANGHQYQKGKDDAFAKLFDRSEERRVGKESIAPSTMST